MKSPTTVLRGARRFGSSDRVDILFAGGRVVAVAQAGSQSADRVVDVDGLTAMPGAIDAHTHPIHDETFRSVGKVAAAGGVTTTLHHLYPEPKESYVDAVARATADARQAESDFGFHLRITPDRASESLTEAAAQPGLVSVKSFLAHTDETVMSGWGDLYRIMTRAKEAGLPVITHAEFGDVLNAHERTLPQFADLLEFEAARPDYLEAAAVHAASSVAELVGARLYVAHISNRLALDAARAAAGRGVQITVESCPHYFFLDASTPLGGLGRVTPPLRRLEVVERMRDGWARGMVNVLASDHCGYGRHEKFPDDVTASGNGLPGIETMLPLMIDAAAQQNSWVSAESIVSALCEAPAKAFGLARKGKLDPGYDADVVLFDPSASWTVVGDELGDRSFYSPYDGRALRGRIEQVYRRGELVFSHTEAIAPSAGVAIERLVGRG